MLKIKRTVAQLFQLESELLGLVDPQTGQRFTLGLLGQPLTLVTKHYLIELKDEVGKITKNINDLKNEQVKLKGEFDEAKQTHIVPEFLDEELTVPNPVYEELVGEFNVLMAEEKEIECNKFKLEEFNITTEEVYPVFDGILREIRKA